MARSWELQRKQSFLAELRLMQDHFKGLGYANLLRTVEAEIARLEEDLAHVAP